MKIVKIDYKNPDSRTLKLMAKTIKRGGIVIAPSSTVYGIVADAFNEKAVKKVFKIKRRNKDKAFNLIVHPVEEILKYGEFDPLFLEIFKKFPGEAFTFAIPKNRKALPGFLNPNYRTIGFRVAFTKFIEGLSKFLKTPFISTSANISELPDVYSTKEVVEYFRSIFGTDIQPDLILDAGKLSQKKKPSPVIEIIGKNIRIIRKGDFSKEFLEKEFKKLLKKKSSQS